MPAATAAQTFCMFERKMRPCSAWKLPGGIVVSRKLSFANNHEKHADRIEAITPVMRRRFLIGSKIIHAPVIDRPIQKLCGRSLLVSQKIRAQQFFLGATRYSADIILDNCLACLEAGPKGPVFARAEAWRGSQYHGHSRQTCSPAVSTPNRRSPVVLGLRLPKAPRGCCRCRLKARRSFEMAAFGGAVGPRDHLNAAVKETA